METCKSCQYCTPDDAFESLFGDCCIKKWPVALKSSCDAWKKTEK